MKPGQGAGPRTTNRFANKQKAQRKPGPGPLRGGNKGPQQLRSCSSDSHSSSSSVSERGDFGGSGSDVEDAEDYCKGGYHPVQIGEKFKGGRYIVLRKLGWGHFSTVWLVLDTHTDGFAALKVQKSAAHYTDAARDEVTLLAQLKAADPSGAHHCVRLLDHFEHAGPHGLHVCIVCEVLGDNLLALIKAYEYKGLPVAVVKNLARQMLVAVDYMHTRCSILHTDLKPENVMLVDTLAPRRWELELPPPPPRAPAGSAGSWGAFAAAAQQQQQQQQQQKAGGGGSGTSGGGGSGDGQLSRSQKKKAKRKAKAAVSGDGGSQSQQAGGKELHGAEEELDVEQAAGGAAPPQPSGGCGVGNGHTAEQQQASEQRGSGRQQASLEVADQPQQLRRRLVYESRVLRSAADLASATAKVVDFGNACWLNKRFTDDVQTRQYRCPEVILGARWGAPADVWSLACVVFELATGDYLFEPKSGPSWDRDEDHLALMIELLGRMPRRVWTTGRLARDFFNRQGELRHIRRLKPWSLRDVLEEKYRLSPSEATGMADFLLPMLRLVPEERATAAEMLRHPWLDDDCGSDKAKVGRGSEGNNERRRSCDNDCRGGGSRRASHRGSSGSTARGSSDGSSERESRSPQRHASSELIPKRSRSPSPRTRTPNHGDVVQ